LAQNNKSSDSDRKVQASAFAEQMSLCMLGTEGLKIGDEVQCEVQLVKDYGIIAKMVGVEGNVQTGFILNDHKFGQKYKSGQSLTCRVLDIDISKKIADLKEVETSKSHTQKDFKLDQTQKGIVELNKDGYIVVSLKSCRTTLGICLNNNFNQDQESLSAFEIGEQIEVIAVKKSKGGFFELVKVDKDAEAPKKSSQNSTSLAELKEGIKLNGQIKSIKQQCIYVQLPKSQNNLK
jgi:ribosomal protein S1